MFVVKDSSLVTGVVVEAGVTVLSVASSHRMRYSRAEADGLQEETQERRLDAMRVAAFLKAAQPGCVVPSGYKKEVSVQRALDKKSGGYDVLVVRPNLSDMIGHERSRYPQPVGATATSGRRDLHLLSAYGT